MSQLNSAFFSVPLTLGAHEQAEQQRRFQPRHKARQVYLNSLTVYAVNYYLNCLGFRTDLAASSSQDRFLSRLLDAADLVLVNYGRLECRYCWPEDTHLFIPHEAQTERLAYLAVQLEPSLREAKLLGFVEQVTGERVSLEHLNSLEDLAPYLEKQKQARSLENKINLETWLTGLIESGWQQLEELFCLTPTGMNFRRAGSAWEQLVADFPTVSGGQVLHLGTAPELLLIVGVLPQPGQKREMWVRITCADFAQSLPAELQLSILDADALVVMQADSQENSAVLLKFRGEIGEQFSIKIVFGQESATYTFII
jgi:hypothetical protein